MKRYYEKITVRFVIVNPHVNTGYKRDTPKDVVMEENTGVEAFDDIISIIY